MPAVCFVSPEALARRAKAGSGPPSAANAPRLAGTVDGTPCVFSRIQRLSLNEVEASTKSSGVEGYPITCKTRSTTATKRAPARCVTHRTVKEKFVTIQIFLRQAQMINLIMFIGFIVATRKTGGETYCQRRASLSQLLLTLSQPHNPSHACIRQICEMRAEVNTAGSWNGCQSCRWLVGRVR